MAGKIRKNVSQQAHDDPTQLLPDNRRFALSIEEVRRQRLREVADTVFHLPDAFEEDLVAKIARAVELYEALNPADGLEGMLAVQMVGTHEAITECLRLAALQNQTFAGREMAFKHAGKLMALCLKKVATLDKHRGKGQQKVTVEHVHIAAGGQAIVGSIETGTGAKPMSKETAVFDQQAEATFDIRSNKVPNRPRKPKSE